MEKQVLSIEQMKHLQGLGLDTSDASMVLIATDNDGCTLDWGEALDYLKYGQSDVYFNLLDAATGDYNHSYREDCGVFTLQDIMELLPKEVKTDTDTYWLTISIYDCKEWYVCYSMSDEFDYYKEFKSKSLLEASYNMLCWCAENEYLETK